MTTGPPKRETLFFTLQGESTPMEKPTSFLLQEYLGLPPTSPPPPLKPDIHIHTNSPQLLFFFFFFFFFPKQHEIKTPKNFIGTPYEQKKCNPSSLSASPSSPSFFSYLNLTLPLYPTPSPKFKKLNEKAKKRQKIHSFKKKLKPPKKKA